MPDIDSIAAAWEQYRLKLLRYIALQVNSSADAEDILSLAFLKLVAYENEKGMPENVVPWLYRVVKNTIIDFYRTKKEFSDLPEQIAEEDPAPDALESLSACVQPMVALLPEPYRTTLHLADIELVSHKDISAITGKSLAATKADVRRARQRLHAVVADCCKLTTNAAATRVLDVEPHAAPCCRKCDP
jgi:RNA polymerase sigma-70 factor (ECF subfamily)